MPRYAKRLVEWQLDVVVVVVAAAADDNAGEDVDTASRHPTEHRRCVVVA